MKTLFPAACLTGLLGFQAPVLAGTGFIETPSACHELLEVAGDRVFLKETRKGCPAPGRVQVTVPDGVSRVRIFADGVFWQEQKLASFNFSAVSDLLEDSRKMGAEMPAPANRAENQGRAAALDVNGRFQSSEYQEKIEMEKERLQADLFRDVIAQFYPGAPAKPAGEENSGRPGSLAADERVYLFISSSVPLPTLRRYAALIDKAGDPNVIMVLRGFVGGMEKAMPTIDYLRELLERNPGCDPVREECDLYRVAVQIDPPLFTRYGVSRVPAFLYLESEGAEPLIAYGDAAVDYQLERINRMAGSERLAGLIRTMRKGFYDGTGKEKKR